MHQEARHKRTEQLTPPSLERFQYAADATHWTSDEWKARQREQSTEIYLASDPQLDLEIAKAFSEIERQNNVDRVFERSPQAPYVEVPTERIVRTPSLGGWEKSYHQPHKPETSQRGENAVIEIGRSMSTVINNCLENDRVPAIKKDATIERALQELCFRNDHFPVFLKTIHGPRGPIYLVQDGSHRVAAAKLIGLEAIHARVGHLTDTEQAKRVWYESLALMSPQARTELMRVYDAIYPPNKETIPLEAEELAHAETYLDEIYDEIELYRTSITRKAEEESRQVAKLYSDYEQAKNICDNASDRQRFERIRAQTALEYLRDQEPNDSLWDDHLPELDEHDCLIRKDGQESYTHATGYDVGNSYMKIMVLAAEKYAQEFPSEVHQFESTN